MVQHASFTLHLLWSTEKTQNPVCVTQYGPPLYLFGSVCFPSSIPPSPSASPLPSPVSLTSQQSSSAVEQKKKKKEKKKCFQNILSCFHLEHHHPIAVGTERVTLRPSGFTH